MFSSPSFCCLCIDLRVGCIILSLLQVLTSSFCVTTKFGEALNGDGLAQATILVASIAGLLGMCGLVGSVQFAVVYLAYKHGCVESPELAADVCQKIPSVLVAMVIESVLGYILDLHYYFVVRTYAKSLNEYTEEGYTAVPVNEPFIPAYSVKDPMEA